MPAETDLRHVWNACVGAGRANEALRADWQAHFREAVDVLGARFVRFHGVFHDDMFVYRVADGGGFGPPTPLPEPVYTFAYVDKVFDAVLATGARPFVELGFLPRELATQTETVFWWKAHCSPPQDMWRWVELVTTTVRHWIERYGIDEVRRWRFEVWNEPNLVPHFWTGTRTQYFELYEATARALKDIDAGLRVGGPSTSVFVPDARYAGETQDRSAEVATAEATDPDALDWQPVWIHEFVDWCATRDVPVDFLSTHLYPTDYAFGADGAGATHPAARRCDLRRPGRDARDHRRGPVPGRRAAHLRVVELAVQPRPDARHALRRHLHHAGVPQGCCPGGLDLVLDLHRRVRGGRRRHRPVPRRVRPGQRAGHPQADVPRDGDAGAAR